MEHTIEEKTASAILQKGTSVRIGKTIYKVSPPSIATLILISEQVSKLPKVSLKSERIVSDSLYIAKDCSILGDIIATLILGAKKMRSTSVLSRIFRRSEHQRLKNKILEEITPSELNALTAKLLSGMQIGDFFSLTTFLIDVNLLSPTKVVQETTAYGQ